MMVVERSGRGWGEGGGKREYGVVRDVGGMRRGGWVWEG